MKKINYLSYIRAFACIAIIILHTVDSAVILYQNNISNGERISSLSVVYSMMWAVPCFVMVTGALLLGKNKEISIKKVFRKYILRIVIAILAFSLINAIFDMFMNHTGVGLHFLLTGIGNALTGNGWAHMWYLYLLIGIYLLLIPYRAVANHLSDTEYRYLLIVYAVFLSILPLLPIWGVKSGFYIHVSTIYPFYLFAGYALAEGKLKLNKAVSVILIVVGVMGLVGSVLLNEKYYNLSYGNLLGYSSVFVVVLSLGVFSVVKNAQKEELLSETDLTSELKEAKPGIIGKILLEIDRCSFGIYLIHMIFVRLTLRYWQINPYSSSVTVLVFAGLIVGMLAVSYGITALLKLIPGVKKIV